MGASDSHRRAAAARDGTVKDRDRALVVLSSVVMKSRRRITEGARKAQIFTILASIMVAERRKVVCFGGEERRETSDDDRFRRRCRQVSGGGIEIRRGDLVRRGARAARWTSVD